MSIAKQLIEERENATEDGIVYDATIKDRIQTAIKIYEEELGFLKDYVENNYGQFEKLRELIKLIESQLRLLYKSYDGIESELKILRGKE